MKVDFSQIKDKFVGESEKRLKAVFDRYAEFVKGNEITPILLLNEADALLSKRIHVTSSVDQMNNSMQNILLEEMENFEGILIATTNLIPNLDNAFERRFLYKIEFTQPDPEVRFHIWKCHFSEIEDIVLTEISEKFNFSGGQIENIARKAKMNELLFLRKVTIDELKEMCNAEFLTPTKRTMGFKSE
jgi:SpoVK/Ycf46/Vps4 family AAA+-type ATPase